MLLRGKDLSLSRRASLALSAPPGQREDALGSLWLGIHRTSRGERRTVGGGFLCVCVWVLSEMRDLHLCILWANTAFPVSWVLPGQPRLGSGQDSKPGRHGKGRQKLRGLLAPV